MTTDEPVGPKISQKLEIVATRALKGSNKVREFSISLGEQRITLDSDQFQVLCDVLDGKQGELLRYHSKGDYSPYESILFSAKSPLHLSSVDEA